MLSIQPSNACKNVLVVFFLFAETIWFAVPQVHPEHTLTVQLHQEFKLLWHEVEIHVRFLVIVVVVCQVCEVVRVNAEGPESVQVHVLAQLQRQAHHHEAGAEPWCLQATRAPEQGHTLKVDGVQENGLDGASKVLDGVESPQGNGRVRAEGEGGKQQQGAAVVAQLFYKHAATPHQSPVPANIKRM